MAQKILNQTQHVMAEASTMLKNAEGHTIFLNISVTVIFITNPEVVLVFLCDCQNIVCNFLKSTYICQPLKFISQLHFGPSRHKDEERPKPKVRH